MLESTEKKALYLFMKSIMLLAALVAACAESTEVTTATASDSRNGKTGSIETVSQVAQDTFRPYLKTALTDYAKKMHRLSSDDSFDNAALDSPLQLNEISSATITECVNRTCTSADMVSAPLDTYLFPVKFNGKIKLMMSMYKDSKSDQFKRGYLGNRTLAKELEKLFRIWQPDEVTLFISNQARIYAFSVSSVAEPNLTLIDRSGASEANYKKLAPLEDTVNILAAKIDSELKQWNR